MAPSLLYIIYDIYIKTVILHHRQFDILKLARYNPVMDIKIHQSEDFEKMRAAGKLAADVLRFIEPYVQPEISTGKLNDLCHEFILDHNAIPAPLNYHGFPKSICTSPNHVVCHGIPSYDKILEDGDILNIDVTVILDGWHGDTNKTFCVGNPSIRAARLVETTYNAMMAGINEIAPGKPLNDIGKAIQKVAQEKGFSTVRNFGGHGIGRIFHDDPWVPHYADGPNADVIMQEGMFFTVEPMINIGRADTKLLGDNWTVVTRDRSLSAQFEQTIGVTATGYEIFTL